jgi:hypothetical protein
MIRDDEQATATATAGFSTAAASAPPSVEMTMFCWGKRERATATATAGFSTAAASVLARSTSLRVEMTMFWVGWENFSLCVAGYLV